MKILFERVPKRILTSAFLGCLLPFLYGCADSDLMIGHGECASWCQIDVTDLGDANLRDVWGHGNQFWIVGQDGIVVDYDGAAWRTNRASSHDLNAIAGDSKGRVFAVGEEGTVLEWDDGQFRNLSTPQYSRYSFTAVTASVDGIWIVGHSSDGSLPEVIVVHLADGQFRTAWQPVEQNRAPFLTGLCITSKGRVFAVGGIGGEPEPLLLSGIHDLEAISMGLAELPSGCASYGDTVAVIDREGLDVTLITEDEIRSVGANLQANQGRSIFEAGSRSAMWLSDERSGVAVADAIVAFDDGDYESYPSPGLLFDVHGDAVDNVFAVGESGLVVRFNGTRWDTVRDSGAILRGVWVSAERVIAVGDKGTILIHQEEQL